MLRSIKLLLRRVWAFVVRDFQLMLSYRLQFFLRVLTILLMVTTLFFISRTFMGRSDCPCAESPFTQWRDPLAAWITGLAVLNYFMTGFSSLANAIRAEQTQGTLESVLLTPINVPTVVVASSAWDFVQATLFSFLYLFFGWLFYDVHFRGSYLLALLFLVLTTLVLACLGILSASFAMVFKRGDPFAVLLGTGSALFSGVFFPTQLLGAGFGTVSRILPPTYGLDGIRRVLIEGQGLAEVQEPLLTLMLFLAVLLPFSLWVFSRAIRRAKREGSLIQY
ncbi:MAG TPA: ABC transporter permease [Pyrinomonadaceae bacterium]|nr:ABC transporter permease [Pyrinomonadaceae bacterium]